MADDERLEQEVRRDLARASRWERAHGGFIAVVAAIVGLGWIVFLAVREWRIWS